MPVNREAKDTPTDNVYQRLLKAQMEIVAPREIDGRFGKARSAEQILANVKPITQKFGLYVHTSDTMTQVGDRNYITATAYAVNVDDPTEFVTATASAWEGQVSAGLDTSQVSGKTSSYAKKYALQNLFAIDDTKDADQEHTDPESEADKKGKAEEDSAYNAARTKTFDEITALGVQLGYSVDVINKRLQKVDNSDDAKALILKFKNLLADQEMNQPEKPF